MFLDEFAGMLEAAAVVAGELCGKWVGRRHFVVGNTRRSECEAPLEAEGSSSLCWRWWRPRRLL